MEVDGHGSLAFCIYQCIHGATSSEKLLIVANSDTYFAFIFHSGFELWRSVFSSVLLENSGQWTEETIKFCLFLYLGLLPINHKLIHDLANIYTLTVADIKRTILRVLETPVCQNVKTNNLNCSYRRTFAIALLFCYCIRNSFSLATLPC